MEVTGRWQASRIVSVWCCFGLVVLAQANAVVDEEFSEELLLRPLPDGNLLAHFHFTTRLPPVRGHGVHHRLFPKAIFQLVRNYRIREMELSFTQGRWNYQRWGAVDPVAQAAAKPVGVELSASFDVPENLVDSTWGNLTHALSGLFCASINFLESSSTYLDPWFAFRPEADWAGLLKEQDDGEPMQRVVRGKRLKKSGTRYGALPREAVCTENLTPWLKLLPCRDKAGLSTLLDRRTIYSGSYHSLRLVLNSGDFDENLESGTSLDQTLTLVLRQDRGGSYSKVPDWTLSTVFGSELKGRCPLAKDSKVYVDIEEGLVKQLVHFTASDKEQKNYSINDIDYEDNPVFRFSIAADRILTGAKPAAVLLEYEATHSELSYLSMSWKMPVRWSTLRGQFYISRFLTGTGNARGSIVLYFRANRACCPCEAKETDIMILQMVPWYVRLYGHTLQVSLDGRSVEFWSVVKLMRFTPAEDRKHSAAIEIGLRVPSDTQVISLSVEYDKGFLHIDEHPPDANRGFDLPAAIISFPNCRVLKQFDRDAVPRSTLLDLLQVDRSLQMYSEVLLMQLATPDFSMPYNVITLTCTVLALYFGSLLNVLRRRIGEEERQSKGKPRPGLLTGKLSKRFGWIQNERYRRLFKVLLVVVIGVALNQYLGS